MSNAHTYFMNNTVKKEEGESNSKLPFDPLQALKFAYERSQNITGSSTACIVSLLNNKLYSVNLGITLR
jgi:hypothetical protein